MVDEVIEIPYHIKAVNKPMQKCKKALDYFTVTKLTLPKKLAAPFDHITNLDVSLIHDSISLQNTIIELICNRQLGYYKSVHKAKWRLMTGCLLPTDFSRDHLC